MITVHSFRTGLGYATVCADRCMSRVLSHQIGIQLGGLPGVRHGMLSVTDSVKISWQVHSAMSSKQSPVDTTFRTPTPSKQPTTQHSHTDVQSPRHMRPIATPAATPALITSPRAANTPASRPGSPIAATQTLHVTSRSQADGAPPPAPPPPHMMLQTNPSHVAVCSTSEMPAIRIDLSMIPHSSSRHMAELRCCWCLHKHH